MSDRNQLARERSIVDQSQEQFLKQIIFPLTQAVQILAARIELLEMPWYKKLWVRIERPISLWFARRRKIPVAQPVKTVVESVNADVQPTPTNKRRLP